MTAVPNVIPADRNALRALRGVPASLRLAGMLLLSARTGSLLMHLPDGRPSLRFGGEAPGPEAEMTVHDLAFARRAIAGGDIGFAEGYMDAQWSTPDLTAVLEFFSDNFDRTRRLARGGTMVRIANMLRHALLRRNTRAGSKRNILEHYDLGNAFYAQWLDPSMTYSSGIYSSPNTSLEQAQKAKYRLICDALGAGPDSHLLEIGCGWGGFAEVAAGERGAKVTGLTISKAQHDYAVERMAKAGLSERVDIRMCDYRDVEGQFDGVASIEMFEAVGEEYWPTYFDKVAQVLRPGGKAALQIITIRDDLFARYRRRADFIQHFIFPGGMLPSDEELSRQTARAGLARTETAMFGQSYALTLKEWARRFNEAWPRIAPLGFDETFRRLWQFYLAYCEAGFRNGRIDVGQFVLART
jgi:cyclopropane-fatty-acyl-phospholipid synthase